MKFIEIKFQTKKNNEISHIIFVNYEACFKQLIMITLSHSEKHEKELSLHVKLLCTNNDDID